MFSISYQTTFSALLAVVFLSEVSSAVPPKKPSLAQFNKLISFSPFTIKPTAPEIKRESPLERDWMIGSIRPHGDKWAVTLINKKDRKDRIRLLPGFSSGDFQLKEVKQDPKTQENSKVLISKGTQTAWITYDEKLIKVRPAAAARGASKKTGTSARRAGPPVPGRSTTNKPATRVRHVPRTGR